MTTPLSDAEARRVTVCPDCEHIFKAHRWSGYRCRYCRCDRPDETLAQVAALLAEERNRVRDEVEDWFTDITLEDLWAVKGWDS